MIILFHHSHCFGNMPECNIFFFRYLDWPRTLASVHLKTRNSQENSEQKWHSNNAGLKMRKAWRSGLRRWFASATHRGIGFWIPPLPRADFGRLALEWHNWLITSREGGGLSNLDCHVHKCLGNLELWKTGERMRPGEGVALSGSLDPNWSRQGWGACREFIILIRI